MFHFVCFDIETGGFDKEKNLITEIALIVYDNLTLEEKFRYDTYIKPYGDLTLEAEAASKTGINLETLKEKGEDISEVLLMFKDVLKHFKEGSKKFSMKPVLVGHNICDFDIPFLNHNFHNVLGEDIFDFCEKFSVDTLWEARTKWALTDKKKFNLSASCEMAGIEHIGAHRAINDVEVNKKLHEFFVSCGRGGTSNVPTDIKSDAQKKRAFRFG